MSKKEEVIINGRPIKPDRWTTTPKDIRTILEKNTCCSDHADIDQALLFGGGREMTNWYSWYRRKDVADRLTLLDKLTEITKPDPATLKLLALKPNPTNGDEENE